MDLSIIFVDMSTKWAPARTALFLELQAEIVAGLPEAAAVPERVAPLEVSPHNAVFAAITGSGRFQGTPGADRDPEVHRVLLDELLVRRAAIVTAAEAIAALS